MQYDFKIDTGHLSPPYDEFYTDFPIELTEEQFERLCKVMRELLDNKIYYSKMPATDDHEWWLHDYLPDIHQKIRIELESRAAQVWGEGILDQLFNVDIYVPDEVWDSIEEEESNNY